MNLLQIEIQLIAMAAAAACALPGVFLVLRRMSLMSDAISHSILLGIVIGFLLIGDVTSPVLVVGAALAGLATVVLVELLERTRLVRVDAAMGLVFPLLFSIAVIIVARFASNVHIDTDAVLLGELALAPFDRLEVAGWDVGPRALWVMAAILVVNIAVVTVLFKELELTSFDAGLATALGFSPVVVHYLLMGVVSVTAVGAFDAVGAILVVALMIAPPSTAYLLTDRLKNMVWLSVVIGIASALIGYWSAHLLDASIAGCMAAAAGGLFALALAFAPERGLVALARRWARQKEEFAITMLTIHLFNHEGLPEAAEEGRIDRLDRHLRWEPAYATDIASRAERRGLVARRERVLTLTEQGRTRAQQAIVD